MVISLTKLRAWLRKVKSPFPKCWAKGCDLRRSIRATARLPCIPQRAGFRFKDPSKSGSWGMENLAGYSTRPIKRKRVDERMVSWDSYVASFRLRLLPGDATMEVSRSHSRERVSARVEKRRRDGVGLASELFTVTARSRCDQAEDGRKRIRVVRRTAKLLPAVIVRPPKGQHQWTLIYLHGMGSSALGNYADRPHYFVDGSLAVKVVVPTSPSREVSCFDSWWNKSHVKKRWHLQKFFSWYDYLSNYNGKKEDFIDLCSLGIIQRALQSIIEAEASELGGRYDRVIIGGKSQGCCTALDAVLTFPERLGGFVGLVGHLLSCTPTDPGGPQVGVPLHFFHERHDKMMRWEWVQVGEQRLRDAGHRVHARHGADPEACGHFINGVEGQWIRSALRSICAPGPV